MAKKNFEQEPAVRKPLLVIGGAAIAALLLGFVLMTFVFNGDGSDDVTAPSPAVQTDTSGGTTPGGTVSTPAPTPVPSEPPGLVDGGRNPFAQRS